MYVKIWLKDLDKFEKKNNFNKLFNIPIYFT